MAEYCNTIDGATTCALCEGALVAGRYVHMQATLLQVFCSPVCVRAATRAERAWRWADGIRLLRRVVTTVAVVTACLVPHQWAARRSGVAPPVSAAAGESLGSESLPAGWFGPEWPPSESSVLALLGRDSWIHPLAGPSRRMPRADTRVFGAARPGHRAVECRNGHCGVDLGGEIWGEQVRAVHEGVVAFVQRGANPDRGGRFVRIAHHNGTVFTQYFHLAAIPRGIERGVHVESGDLIGLLGDSGVKESQPHLHFSVSIKVSERGFEKYIDPEPLIALWPLRVPIHGSDEGLVTTVASPGTVLGSAPLRRSKRARKSGGAKETVTAAASSDLGAGPGFWPRTP